MKQALSIFIGAAIFCSLGDAAHVLMGIDGYPPKYQLLPLLNIPWWVPLEFGVAGLAIGLGAKLIDPLVGYSPKKAITYPQIALGGLLFFLIYLASSFLPLTSPGTKDIALGIFALLFWWLFEGSSKGLMLAVVAATVGTLAEITLVKQGVFFYHPGSAHLFGVPSWLPWIYIPGAIAGAQFFRIKA